MSWRRGGRARLRLLDRGGRDVRWELAELGSAPLTIGRIELPVPMAPDRLGFRREVADSLRRARTTAPPSGPRQADRDGEDHGEQLRRSVAQIRALEQRSRRDESSLARRFDAVAAVLRDRGHLDAWTLTETGRLVARIYHEVDLLVAETLAAGILDDLGPVELASIVSVFTYEHRSPTPPPPVWFPSKTGKLRFDAIEKLARDIRRLERRHGVVESRRLDAGFVSAAWAWADGQHLSDLLDDELSAGDFVRNVKQLIDLMRQIAVTAPRGDTRSSATASIAGLHRGVVALSGTVEE